MPEVRIASTYTPEPRQVAFHRSKAVVRGYGGAMGGGKSRALCEDVFQDMLDHPGIQIPIFRLKHVSITETTKRTMVGEVIPPQLLRMCDRKASGGEDYIRLPNGSTVHFAGLDDPVRWFSSELGGLGFDEAHEIPEDSVLKLMTRLRQRGMPCRVRLCFNPENPGHWLFKWFIAGGESRDLDGRLLGHYKRELYPTDAVKSVGDCEFIFAPPDSNPHLPEGYVENTLGGLPELLRRRYRDGEWLFTSGVTYFDTDALAWYATRTIHPGDRFDFRASSDGRNATRVAHELGKIRVYEPPVEDHKYAIGADVATGRGKDFSAAYVVDLTSMSLVAEFHGKLDEDLYAEQLHFLGRWYNTALIAVETGGGFGEAVIVPLRDGRSGRPPYPNLYRHVLSSRPDLPFAKPYGFPMNLKTRSLALSQLELAVREKALPFLPQRLLDECVTFVHADTNPSPRAQDGCHDDCVMAAAITLEMYRLKGAHPAMDARRDRQRKRVREYETMYPWQENPAASKRARRRFDLRYRKEAA